MLSVLIMTVTVVSLALPLRSNAIEMTDIYVQERQQTIALNASQFEDAGEENGIQLYQGTVPPQRKTEVLEMNEIIILTIASISSIKSPLMTSGYNKKNSYYKAGQNNRSKVGRKIKSE